MELESIRREYLQGGLERENLLESPVKQFQLWLEQAVKSGLPDPTAMVLATVDAKLQPQQRIVLLKHADEQGFVFYTNYDSAKAHEISSNHRVSVLFPWHILERQVRIEGCAEKVSTAESLKYFLTRPKESQIAAWSSEQSRRIDSRALLISQFERMKSKFGKGEIPLPDFWGGYRIRPKRFEFWQGRENRLHDRFEYSLMDDNRWEINRLAP